jgi:tRNA-specific 2-thiouridylase
MAIAVVLFSGGLDSTLAIRILQQQGLDVEAMNVRTPFDCCRAPAAQAAADLGVRLTVLSADDDYVDLIRRPSYGYGRAVNPCVDCRIYLCAMARLFMEQVGACLVATGEVLGQRPMSQKRRHLEVIADRSGLEGRLVRPLSARLLPPTIPEREGVLDREGLFAFTGQGRKPLIDLAQRLGIRKIPGPSSGCPLTEPRFAPRVRDLIALEPQAGRLEFELLNYGRHVRVDRHTKVIVGRNLRENAVLRAIFQRESTPRWALLEPRDFSGPSALVCGQVSDETLRFAAALVLRYSRQKNGPADASTLSVTHQGETQSFRAEPVPAAAAAKSL